jgi:uncharacterized membrane protein YsdA (DUF1294 family)
MDPVLLMFFLLYALLTWAWHIPPWVGAAYLAWSLICFVAYAHDKAAARAGQWRTRESSLHLLALLGGWPGALLAQRHLRHKSGKPSFRAVFWLTVWINIAVFVLLSSPFGGHWDWLR